MTTNKIIGWGNVGASTSQPNVFVPFGGNGGYPGFPMPISGTISDLYVNIGANTSTSSVSYTLHKNGSATPLSITVTALATGLFTDLVHSVTIVEGDLINLTVDQSCSRTTTRCFCICCVFILNIKIHYSFS